MVLRMLWIVVDRSHIEFSFIVSLGRLSAPKPIVDLSTVNFKVLYVSPYDDGGN